MSRRDKPKRPADITDGPANAAYERAADAYYEEREHEALRDAFAMSALKGLLANPMASREIARDAEDGGGHRTGHFGAEVARNAYDIADAMLAAREAKP